MGFDLKLFLIELHKQGFIKKHDIDFMLEHDPIPTWFSLVLKLYEQKQELQKQIEELKEAFSEAVGYLNWFDEERRYLETVEFLEKHSKLIKESEK